MKSIQLGFFGTFHEKKNRFNQIYVESCGTTLTSKIKSIISNHRHLLT